MAAIQAGADAVYIGGKSFSLRALAGNFTNEEILEAVEFAHSLGKKVYVTEVTVDSFQLLSSKNSNETAGGYNSSNNMGYTPDVNNGFSNGFSQNNTSNFDDFGSHGMDVSDDELPF